uniref:40S ribosomal protein S30 n=1 Tax=Neovison vison TaxID=452646 RepID=A0A8C7AVE0_NEOVI
MQLFVHAQELHALEVTGQETVCGVKALTSLEVASCMLGGKFHSSLACTGKLRGQIPKVSKQEKKKKTGQAKQQMQYSWRFVKVVPTFGKKKGRNANS